MSERSSRVIRRALETAFIGVFLLLIWMNVSLRNEVVSLKAALQKERTAAVSDVFKAGDTLGPLPVRGLDGKEFLLDPRMGHKPKMFLVIDPGCEACQAAVEDFRNGKVPRRAVVILSVVEQGTREFAQQRQIAGFTYVLLKDELPVHIQKKFLTLPTTLFVDPSGRITDVCSRPAGCQT